ncbi:class IIb bacteriocin, lactobin A/cerein 7B family [Chryseobacterium piperi]|uniref:class IIb bacteriocin, lactobin A/cerein 7B family n=1 Tax=Chryseobacterium piperi TaxID=558152 RepID=UPI000A6FB54E|nr:class IIb bacteriocin, lactobin A/cerein 7B family [Chryseobacterium piperi]
MKKSNIQQRKLTKKELKEINGGAGPICPVVFSCFDRRTGEELIGVPGIQDGYCC